MSTRQIENEKKQNGEGDEEENAPGCEVSFSFKRLVVREEQEQPGSLAEKGTSTAR